MTISPRQFSTEIEYPDGDGKPMAESDQTCTYLIYARQVLRIYFQNRQDVYVAGNLFIYYQKGNSAAVVAPDVFVVIGVTNGDRRSYKVWEEGNKAPDFVLEITSKSTKKEDQETKPQIYANLGVTEYFQYDPTGDYLNPKLQGLRLVNGVYQPIAATVLADDIQVIGSEELGLELRSSADSLRFYDPVTSKTLLAHEEAVQAQLEAEERARRAEARIAELEARLRELQSQEEF